MTRLSDPFPGSAVSWRVGATTKDKTKGMALAYITARNVMDRLDEVYGVLGWQDRYEFHGPRIVCTISVWDFDKEQWIEKADGAGDTDVEAEKGGLSDAFKRAAVKLGVGRYLYDTPSPWVKITGSGKSWRIDNSEMAGLSALVGGAPPNTAPAPAEDERLVTSGDLELLQDRIKLRCTELEIPITDNYPRCGKDIVFTMGLARAREMPLLRFDEALRLVDEWRPHDPDPGFVDDLAPEGAP